MKKKKGKSERIYFLSDNFPYKKKIAIAIFIFSSLLGINTLNHSFTLDDEIYYSKNKISQQGISGIADMFSKGSTSGFKETGKKELYRPLVLLSFGFEKALFNNKPRPSHFLQILLYGFCCVVLYSLLNILFSSFHFLVPLFITFLFASHPVHTEVIASIKSRDELLAFLFSILSLRQFVLVEAENSVKRTITGLFFLLCALLSKESAVMMVAVIPLTLYFFSAQSGRKILHIALFTTVILVFYFLVRITVIPWSTIVEQPDLINNALMAASTNAEMLTTNFLILGTYLKLLFLPFPLSYDYSYNQIQIVNWNNLFAISSFAVYLLLFVFAVANIKKKNPISYGIFFFFLTFFLSSNLLIKIDATIGLRFLFTPVLGFCIAIVFLVYKVFKIDPSANELIKEKKKIAIIFSVIISVFSILTIIRNADWKDNFTLFSHDIEVSPNSARIQSSLGFEYAMKAMNSKSIFERNEHLRNSIKHYKQAVEIYPDHPDAYYNLGLAFFNAGEREKSIQCYWKASEVNPKLIDPLKEVGGIYYNDHRNDSALYYFKRVLTIDSTDEKAIEIVNYLERNSN